MKEKTFTQFTPNSTRKYIDILQQLVKAKAKVWLNLYGNSPQKITKHKFTASKWGKMPVVKLCFKMPVFDTHNVKYKAVILEAMS